MLVGVQPAVTGCPAHPPLLHTLAQATTVGAAPLRSGSPSPSALNSLWKTRRFRNPHGLRSKASRERAAPKHGTSPPLEKDQKAPGHHVLYPDSPGLWRKGVLVGYNPLLTSLAGSSPRKDAEGLWVHLAEARKWLVRQQDGSGSGVIMLPATVSVSVWSLTEERV